MKTIFEAIIKDSDRVMAIVGAGGKTSLMFALAHGFQKNGEKVITTTTTRILAPTTRQSKNVLLVHEENFSEKLATALDRDGHVTIADRLLSENKLEGLPPHNLTDILHRSPAERMIIEADGARGLSLKAPGKYEPVVPNTTDCCIAVIGLDCIGKPLTEENVFRPGQISLLTGLQPGEVITPGTVTRLITHPQGLFKDCPKKATRIIFLNKTDITGGNTRAAQIIQATVGATGRLPNALFAGSIRNNTCLPAFCIPQVR